MTLERAKPLDSEQDCFFKTEIRNEKLVVTYLQDDETTPCLIESINIRTGIVESKQEVNPHAGILTPYIAFHKNGLPKIKAMRNVRDMYEGDFRQYYSNGQLEIEGTANGKGGYKGLYKEYTSEGDLVLQGTYSEYGECFKGLVIERDDSRNDKQFIYSFGDGVNKARFLANSEDLIKANIAEPPTLADVLHLFHANHQKSVEKSIAANSPKAE